MIQTKKQAAQITHTLSNTAKMPCKSYGLPALVSCETGRALAKVEGSVCSNCYACRGCYSWNSTATAQAKRMNAIANPDWVKAMIVMIGKDEYFRWHDSGDLVSYEYLLNVVDVIRQTPGTQHWIPTKQRNHITRYIREFGAFPGNVVVRLSGAMINGKPPVVPAGVNTSTVHTKGKQPHGKACKAPWQQGECRNCRMCWNPDISNVSYIKH